MADLIKLDADLDIIQKLDDEPNDVGGLSSAELKAEFDKAGNAIKTYLNDTLIPGIEGTGGEGGLVGEQIAAHNAAPDAHADIRQEIADNKAASDQAIALKLDSATIKSEGIPEIVSPETLRTYFYGKRKETSRSWQFEVSTGSNENMVSALGGFPDGHTASEKWFLYVDLPYTEAGGFVIHAQLEGRDNGLLYRQDQFATLDQRWHTTGWIRIQDVQKNLDAHIADPEAHPDIREQVTFNHDAVASVAADLFQHSSNTDNPHEVTYEQVGADAAGSADAALETAKGTVVVADCYDEAASPTSAPNTWYVSKDTPKPSGEAGMTIDVRWKNGHAGGLGYSVKVVWGAPDAPDNETILSGISVTNGLTGEVSIPVEGTVRYQLINRSGSLGFKYVSGHVLSRQFSSATVADTADKAVHGLSLSYLPGMDIYVQMENGNTADTMRLVPDEGSTLPVYGNGLGAKTGEIPAGYILHLKNAEDHWQIINQHSAGGGGAEAEKWATEAVKDAIPSITDEATFRTHFYELRKSQTRKYQFEISTGGIHENIVTGVGGRPQGVSADDSAFLYVEIPFSEAGGFVIKATYELRSKAGIWEKKIYGTLDSRWQDTGWYQPTYIAKTIIAPHGSGSKADMTASQIINAARKGVVQAEYTDPGTGELRTYPYFKQMPDGRAAFAINGYIEDGVPKQTLIYVDYAGNVTTETRDADMVTPAEVDAKIEAAIGAAIGGAY